MLYTAFGPMRNLHELWCGRLSYCHYGEAPGCQHHRGLQLRPEKQPQPCSGPNLRPTSLLGRLPYLMSRGLPADTVTPTIRAAWKPPPSAFSRPHPSATEPTVHRTFTHQLLSYAPLYYISLCKMRLSAPDV